MPVSKSRIAILLTLFFLAVAGHSRAQERDDLPIKVRTYLVHIPVIASDRDGRYVSGLKKEDFSIFEDGTKQEISFFADEKEPMNVVILIDTSFSTRAVLDDIKKAARDFVRVFRLEDKGMIASFDFEMKVLQEFTSDQKQLSKAINKTSIGARPGSNMQDSVYALVKKQLTEVKGRKAIIVLTDGEVGGSVVSDETLINTLAESDVLVYTIIFQTPSSYAAYRVPESIKSRNGVTISGKGLIGRLEEVRLERFQFMSSLGAVTGGRLLDSKAGDFRGSFQVIADELKNQYLIGFYPRNPDDEKPHNVVVETSLKDTVLRSKRNIVLKLNKRENN